MATAAADEAEAWVGGSHGGWWLVTLAGEVARFADEAGHGAGGFDASFKLGGDKGGLIGKPLDDGALDGAFFGLNELGEEGGFLGV